MVCRRMRRQVFAVWEPVSKNGEVHMHHKVWNPGREQKSSRGVSRCCKDKRQSWLLLFEAAGLLMA